MYATAAFSVDLIRAKIKEEHNVYFARGYMAKLINNPFYHGVMLIKNKLYPHRYPPVISKQLFDQVQEIKSRFKKKPFKFAGLPYIYRGMIRCGHCGLSITPEKHKGLVYYHCTQYKGKHDAKWLREEKITEELANFFKRLEMPKEIAASTIKTLNDVHKDKVEFHNAELEKITSELKTVTKMMDNLYLDKLKGRITDSEYDRFHTSLKDQSIDLNIRLNALQEAEDNYFLTAKRVLLLVTRAHELFVGSEVEERRQFMKLVLSNLRIEDEKLLWDVQKPFDLIVNCSDRSLWRDLFCFFFKYENQKWDLYRYI